MRDEQHHTDFRYTDLAPKLRTTSLGKRYAKAHRYALRDFSLDLAPGEISAIVGHSGSGKTTALRLIAGFEVPDEGSVEIDGRLVSDPSRVLPPETRGVGVVFQDQALFPHLTVFDNIAFGLAGRTPAPVRWIRRFRGAGSAHSGEQAAQAEVERVMELTGIPGLEARYPHELSGGQMQRVAIARALAPKPELLLLDEPFNNLDATLKRRFTRELSAILRETETSALIVTHDRDEAFALARRIVFLKDGMTLQSGTPKEVYQTPARADVASFFGPVNVIAAYSTERGYETAFGAVTNVRNGTGLKTVAAGNAADSDERELLVRPESLIPSGNSTGQRDGTDVAPAGAHVIPGPYGSAFRADGIVREVTFRGTYYEILVEPLPSRHDIPAPPRLEVHVRPRDGKTAHHAAHRHSPGEHITLTLASAPVCATCLRHTDMERKDASLVEAPAQTR
ncbi:MAG: ABC transporter ATP-binding protein [Spirochaetota bacterium]